MIEERNTGVLGRFKHLGQDGQKRRLGIMGGTFDPIHFGHLRTAEEVREALKLDGVLFVPTGTHAFKKESVSEDGDKRMDSVRQAIADNPHFDLSPVEVQRDGNSYSVETVEQLRALFPKNVELFFIVGSDSANNLAKWKQPHKLTAMAQFVVATGRPRSPEAVALKSKLESEGFLDLRYVPVSALDIASTDLRNKASEGKSLRYLLPEVQRLQLMAKDDRSKAQDGQGAIDALSDEFYEQIKEELRSRVSEKRFDHSVAVSQTAEKLALQYGVDPKKARLAGIIHDWDKGMNDEAIRQRVKDLGLEDYIDPKIVETLPGTLHGITAAEDLKQRYPEIPSDVISAVRLHTIASTNMSPLEMILYIADGIEPNRHYGTVDDVRDLVGEVGLERLFFEAFKYWTTLIMSRGKLLHPNTINVWNAYALPKPKPGKDF